MAHFDLHKAPPRQQKKTILTFKESNNSKINQIYVKILTITTRININSLIMKYIFAIDINANIIFMKLVKFKKLDLVEI